MARYNATLPGIFRGLVMPDGAQPAPGGFRMPAGTGVDWEHQADRTLDAWGRGGFASLSVTAGSTCWMKSWS